MKFDNLNLRLDQILDRKFQIQSEKIEITGCSSITGLAFFLSQSTSNIINNLPHLVVVGNSSDANRFAQTLSSFDSTRHVHILSGFDENPFSHLYPKNQLIAERINFLYQAQHAKAGDIFVAPITALLQKTLPFNELRNHSYIWSKGSELPNDINQLLNDLGYIASPLIEDIGQFSIRGGILDIFSPAHQNPVRIELFGDTIESIRFFQTHNQQSIDSISKFTLVPCKEIIWNDDLIESVIEKFRSSTKGRKFDQHEFEEIIRSLSRKNSFPGIDFLLPYFYKKLDQPLSHFNSELNIWYIDPTEITKNADLFFSEIKNDHATSKDQVIYPEIKNFYLQIDELEFPQNSKKINLSSIFSEDLTHEKLLNEIIQYQTNSLMEVSNLFRNLVPGSESWIIQFKQKLIQWKSDGYTVYFFVKGKTQSERLGLFFEKCGFELKITHHDEQLWNTWKSEQIQNENIFHLIQKPIADSIRFVEEKIILFREEDLFGKKIRSSELNQAEEFHKQAKRLSFGDLKPGDCVVHILHGIGVYEGLKVMNIAGVESEYIQISYKDKDKLYLPVYRVSQLQKYSGSAHTTVLDKLGGTGWEKTKTKVRSHLRDIASDLLNLYAKRAELHRPSFHLNQDRISSFEAVFPYDETEDQWRAIQDIMKDLSSTKPMDRLICGDVGFGKTEVAMRAAFVAAENKKQVAVLAPTTILTFQHFETFKKRFQGQGFEIRELNRFVSNTDVKKTLKELSDGKVDIIIGTHRMLSKDVNFLDLGLLIIDEEQKFGVTHKEKIRKLKSSVDTISMSATPIPRTLNMSLVGIRDLSLINTAPVDRLPTRTFITKWDDDVIRKAILSEISRGGQVYFLHNRVQSIYGIADELKKIVPEARIKIGHGQMNEDELEKTMVQFFNHEIDVLVCTAIVESGMDIPRANTMFIDQAHIMGLSQLYQLRGRVGRSKQRAYCYLILPKNKTLEKDAQERLKVIQENTALGSGIRIAQYDLELRGAGEILGEEQSGHINSVGYELYMDLLNEAIHEKRGDPVEDSDLDPEINLRIPALIPDKYISDIRLRLSYYKALADIRNTDDMDKIEAELTDQFGEIPEQTLNLMGLMLIRSQCKTLGVRDISSGLKNISLVFTQKTKIKPETVIQLAMRENKKYSITPDNRLNIRMNSITWPAVYEELTYLLKL